MPIIPFKAQRLPVTIEQIERQIAQGKGASGDELCRAIESSLGRRLDDRVRKLISRVSVPAVKLRGRPRSNNAAKDFALEKVDDEYPSLLSKHEEESRQRRLSAAAESSVLPDAEPTPSELAYTELLTWPVTQDVFPNLSWMALRNEHSRWKNGHFHSVEGHVDSNDFDAKIERLFPSPSKS